MKNMNMYEDPDDFVRQHRPDMPVSCFRPPALERSAKWFVGNFPGNVLYAVKANPAPYVISGLYAAGIRHFDTASLFEVQLVRGLFPDAELFFMHPVKSRQAIERAYFDYGVRSFVFDSLEELEKIVVCTGKAEDLDLVLRIAVPNTASDCPLSDKFGVAPETAPEILKTARKVSKRLGISFHVGSQTIDPEAYVMALTLISKILHSIPHTRVDIIDVGGGFPSVYPDMTPTPPLSAYIDAVKRGVALLPHSDPYELWCEPGRALVAESTSIVVRVELRKDDVLYINDGSYGGMIEAMTMKFSYPARLIRLTPGGAGVALKAFRFYGPTCDSVDYMPGPFWLPKDIREGDYIEIGQLGAYGNASRSNFNGFGATETIIVKTPPLATMYDTIYGDKHEKADGRKRGSA